MRTTESRLPIEDDFIRQLNKDRKMHTIWMIILLSVLITDFTFLVYLILSLLYPSYFPPFFLAW